MSNNLMPVYFKGWDPIKNKSYIVMGKKDNNSLVTGLIAEDDKISFFQDKVCIFTCIKSNIEPIYKALPVDIRVAIKAGNVLRRHHEAAITLINMHRIGK